MVNAARLVWNKDIVDESRILIHRKQDSPGI